MARYNLVLNAKLENPKEFFLIAKNEQGEKNRSKIKIEKKEKDIIFKITSKDATALRASLNSMIKMLTIYEKTKSLIE